MVTDPTVARYGRRGAHAWVSPAFTYPPGWTVSIPRARDTWVRVKVVSLDAALRLAAEHDVELDVDDWTYAAMLVAGVAPPTRPEHALQPVGEYPGKGLEGDDIRPAMLALSHQAARFMGLTEQDAYALARELAVEVEVLDEDEVVTADSAPSRLRLSLEGGRVYSAAVG